ncbi:MAG: hypothetical protein R3B09_29320 [Nannocystaceae bacterium]
MHLRWLPWLLCAPLACAGDDSSDTSASSTSTSTSASTDATTTGEDTTAATGTATTMTTTTDATSTTMSTSSTTSTTSTTSESTSTSTGGLELCHFGSTGDSGGSQSPWLEVYNHGIEVADGETVSLECGLQGLFMFALTPYFAGYTPDDEFADFTVVMDVEGYNLNPDGHFYSFDHVSFYMGCEQSDGGVGYIIPVIPPDTIADPSVLDGLPASITVTLHPDVGDDVTIAAMVTLAAKADSDWEFCQP